ncbi:MAG: DUF6502 family protein [Marinicella sp.]|nr:hypothetical protein [Xanthomonadales bacterium]
MTQQVSKPQNLSFDVYWLDFIRTCLRPLIRILVKQKVEFNSFQNLVRELFVEEAERYIEKTTQNSRGKISSIAYQTGLDRREVSKILKQNFNQDEILEQNRSREGSILDHWRNQPPFCDENNNPLPLKRSGTGLSFERLAQRFGKNISHGPVLESLLKAGCVVIKNGKVVYKNKSYTPPTGVNKEKARIAGLSINRLIRTINHNFSETDNTNFQRNLYTIRVPEESREAFKAEVTKMIRDVYEDVITPQFDLIEEKYESMKSQAKNDPIGLGFFYFND